MSEMMKHLQKQSDHSETKAGEDSQKFSTRLDRLEQEQSGLREDVS